MYFKKEEIVQKVEEISQERHHHDSSFSELQRLINNNKKYEVVQLRRKFMVDVENLQGVVRDSQSVLDLLNYRCEKLTKEGVNLSNQVIRIQSLKQYFLELKSKLAREQQRGEQIIAGRQRWQLTKFSNGGSYSNPQDQQQSLLNSRRDAKDSVEMARTAYESLADQGSRLVSARDKMSNVLKNINLSGNIAQFLRTRTRQDNRLIALLSLGLVIEILVCVFVIKPWLRGGE